MRYLVYGTAVISAVAVVSLWVRLGYHWKIESNVRYAKLAAVIVLTAWVIWLGGRVNRYRKINNLRDRMKPTIEFAVQHALRQRGTTPEEKVEMERHIRARIEEMIEKQVDHE